MSSIPVVDIFDTKRTDVHLASGTLPEMQEIAGKLNKRLNLVIACTMPESENSHYELILRNWLNYQISLNGQVIISDEMQRDMILIDQK